MNAASVIEDTLLVVIALPSYSNTVPREKVSVNLSGPSGHTLNNLKIPPAIDVGTNLDNAEGDD